MKEVITMKKKYKIITSDLQKSLIEFLDEIQFDAAAEGTPEEMQKVNFCTYAIKELLDSFDGYLKDKPSDIKPQKKSRDTYVEETFMDWNMPDMSDEDYEKLVDQFDNFLRNWEKKYNESNPDKEQIDERPTSEFKPHLDDVIEYCDLDEIGEMLKDDTELSETERFDLYYEERERRRIIKENKKIEKNSLSLEQIMKDLKINPANKN
jgi:hypothetical protein|tara:strand:- start:532 stop:1155 length:624 start_codon:yes stop_codon:yes gene_type:complete